MQIDFKTGCSPSRLSPCAKPTCQNTESPCCSRASPDAGFGARSLDEAGTAAGPSQAGGPRSPSAVPLHRCPLGHSQPQACSPGGSGIASHLRHPTSTHRLATGPPAEGLGREVVSPPASPWTLCKATEHTHHQHLPSLQREENTSHIVKAFRVRRRWRLTPPVKRLQRCPAGKRKKIAKNSGGSSLPGGNIQQNPPQPGQPRKGSGKVWGRALPSQGDTPTPFLAQCKELRAHLEQTERKWKMKVATSGAFATSLPPKDSTAEQGPTPIEPRSNGGTITRGSAAPSSARAVLATQHQRRAAAAPGDTGSSPQPAPASAAQTHKHDPETFTNCSSWVVDVAAPSASGIGVPH